MGHGKLALNWVSIFILVLMVASIPFVQPSRTCLQVRTTISENRETQGLQIKEADRAFGNGAKVLRAVEDSARLVPTGPDPLHHNNNPIKP
ncbi:hypothetical protein M0R45_017903 [Rubus argutus]|uniref:Uncharacterized protein n=1 Tax=Rubus argutus TaxID=59490 RepID=A0AAW1XZS7_RUBAR